MRVPANQKAPAQMWRIIFAGLIGIGAAVFAAAPARAQTYPDKVIKLVVPAGPGGPTDVLARLVADRMATSLGQSVIVDNRGGAGGALAARAVALAEPDGYTLLFGNTATLANIPAVSNSAGYDPSKSFSAVAKVMDPTCSWSCARIFRRPALPSSSPMPAPIRASSTRARPGPETSRISPANCSG